MSLHQYAGMVFHSARIEAFRRAIEDSVRPGMRVLDLGTGLGTYALFAARAGASRVVAVDAHPVIHVARDLARANGASRVIEFVCSRAPEGIPPGEYDLVVFEDYPTRLLDAPTHQLLRAVAERHLAPGGRLLPGAARLCLAPVRYDGPTDPAAVAEAWTRFGVDWGELRLRLADTAAKVHLAADRLLGPPARGERLDLLATAGGTDLGLRGEWAGTGHPVGGLALWFDLEVAPAGWVTNAPDGPGEPWGQCFLPLDPPLSTRPGAPVRGWVACEALRDGTPSWLGWGCSSDGDERRGHEFAGLPLSREDLFG